MTTSDNGPGTEITRAGGAAIASVHETSVAAVAAQAKAIVEARYLMALHRPRDMDDVRVRLLRECKRPGFAEVARYRKPIGAGVEGPSIRFAEAAVRTMGNIDVQTPAIYDSPEKRILRVSVTDLETNATYSHDVTVTKTVERRKLAQGQTAISARINSSGQMVYLVEATDDDILNKQNALISKAIRNCALRLLPGDILDESMRVVVETQRTRDAADPDAARKKIVDAFAEIAVKPPDLKAYLGHSIESCSPAELADLRALWAAIRDGEATWSAAMESRAKDAGDSNTGGDSDGGRAQKAKDAVKRAATGKTRSPSQQAEEAALGYDPATGEVAPEDEPPPDNDLADLIG